MTDITIRPILDLTRAAHVREVQRLVWGGPDADLIPDDVLITMAKNGGVILAADAPDGPPETGGMVGLLLGWPGVVTMGGVPRLKHCSHALGVLPGWRGRDVGVRLKLAQREAILAQGVTDWVTWTYDPLLRPNARLNIHRLGGTSATYVRDAYGAMSDALNAGLPSDRLVVDWHLRSPRVAHALAPGRGDPPWELDDIFVMSTYLTASGAQAPGPPPVAGGGLVAVPLPEDVPGLRRGDHALLLEWRLALRAALEGLFAAGYTLADCAPLGGAGAHYILTPPGYVAGGPWP